MSFDDRGDTSKQERFPKEDQEKIRSSLERQSEFKNMVVTSRHFTRLEKTAIQLDDRPAFDDFWNQTKDAKMSFDKSHDQGLGAWSKDYQRAASVARNFMDDFSPIIQVVKDFAGPYGGIAVGTISLLFTVASRKEEFEEQLALTISAIKDRLPGLRLYQHIYNEKHELDIELQSKIVLVYQSFIDFSISATRYYKKGGPRRWFQAFLGIPSNLIESSDQVQKNIVDVRHLCEELLDKNVHTIKELTKQQQESIKALQAKVDQQNYETRLNEIQRFLGIENFSEENQLAELNKHRRAIASDDQLSARIFQQMRDPEIRKFKSGKDYQSWIASQHSSLLILSGLNNQSVSGSDQCWLSTISLSMVDELHQHLFSSAYAYYVFPTRGDSLYNVLAVVVIQLLRKKPVVLDDDVQRNELHAELHELQKYKELSNNNDNYDDEVSCAVLKVILRVIGLFKESDEIYIVLDRADRCRNLRTNGFDHRKSLMKALVKMVEVPRIKVKILVVMDSSGWRLELYQDDLWQKSHGKVTALKLQQEYVA